MKRNIFALFMVLAIMLAVSPPAFAADSGEGNAYRVGKNTYSSLTEAVETLTEDGQTIELLDDVELGASITSSYDFTLDGGGNTVTTTGRIYWDGSGTATLENITFDLTINSSLPGTDKVCSFNVSGSLVLGSGCVINAPKPTGNFGSQAITVSDGTLTIQDGAVINSETSGIKLSSSRGTSSAAMYGGRINAASTGVAISDENCRFEMHGGTIEGNVGVNMSTGCSDSVVSIQDGTFKSSRCGINVGSGNVEMSGGSMELGEGGVGIKLYGYSYSRYPISFDLSGGSFSGGDYDVYITSYACKAKLNPTSATRVFLGSDIKLDLTGFNTGAALDVTLDEDCLPEPGSSIVMADIEGQVLPEGLSLTNEGYAIEAGKKLDAGLLFVYDASAPVIEQRGNGTKDDPFLVASVEELAAAVSKANTRNQMTYVLVDGPITIDQNPKLVLSGSMTLSAKDPERDIITHNKSALLTLAGQDMELVLENLTAVGIIDDYSFQSGFVAAQRDANVSGRVVINDGAVFRNFSSVVISAETCDIVVNGGRFIDCTGTVISNRATITINGGSFENVGYTASTNGEEIYFSGQGSFSSTSCDFQVTSTGYPTPVLTGPLQTNIKVMTTSSFTGAVIKAQKAEYLEGWEQFITVSPADVELMLSADGTELVVKGADRQKVSFVRSGYSSSYGTLPIGSYLSAGTNSVRMGQWWIDGISQVAYNGLDMKAQFKKVLMLGPDGKPLANFIDSAGEALTDGKGYIINWDSPDLEYYTTWRNSITGDTGTVYGSNGVIDNIPASSVGISGQTYIKYKGSDQYLPCTTYDQFSINCFEMLEYPYSSGKLVDGVTITVTDGEVTYTGEEVTPKVEITVENSGLMGGQKVTLEEGVDYYLETDEADWNVGENRTARIYFQGNYYPVKLAAGFSGGWPVTFDVVKGELSIDARTIAAAPGTAEQSFDLSGLAVTPAQDAYTYSLGTVTGDALSGVRVEGGKLFFTPAKSGTATVTVNVDSANASGAAVISVTVTDKTSGAVTLRQGEKTYYFDSLGEAMEIAQPGDTIVLNAKLTEDVTIDKALTIQGGGINGKVTISAGAKLQGCDLSGAEVTLTAGAAGADLTRNYWNSLAPTVSGAVRSQLYPFYRDAAMTKLVEDPAEAVNTAIDEADTLIFDQSDNLISLKDIRNKMNDPEVQQFLRGHKDDFEAILDKLNSSVEEDVLAAYFETNPEAKELVDLLKLAYDVSCTVVPLPSEPDVSSAADNASTEAGEALVTGAKTDIAANTAVSGFIPIFGGSVDVSGLEGTDSTTMVVYLKMEVTLVSLSVDEDGVVQIDELEFEVTPKYSVDDNAGPYSIVTNDKINGSVTFRLPIPESVTQRYAKVEHAGDAPKYLDILSEGGFKFIELSADSFSPFTVTFVDSKPGSGGYVPTMYRISKDADISNGSVNVTTRAVPGSTVVVTAVPDEGYVLRSLYVRDGSKTLALTELGGGKFSFTMPNSDVTVYADFVPAPDGLPFSDVRAGDWFYDAVKYVSERGLMTGTADGIFSPNMNTTRGMLVTILYRIEGEPAVGTTSTFTDVPEGRYYANAVDWAAANGIIAGYSEQTFGPEDAITREQLAAVLYRYAEYKGLDVTGRASLGAFSDADELSAWAEEPMAWAVRSGLFSGRGDGILAPAATATRAEIAQLLMNFAKLA